MRHQLLTGISLLRGASDLLLGKRSSGGLTGSKLALLLSRVPIFDTMAELSFGLLPMGFKTDLTNLLFASYVDNIYVAANFCEDALACLKAFFRYLADCWGLELKSGSESLLVPPGADISKVPDPSIVVHETKVLGWRIRGDGSMSTQWAWLERVMWAAF